MLTHLGRGRGHCSLPAARTGTADPLGCVDVGDKGEIQFCVQTKLLEQRGFLLMIDGENHSIKCAALPSGDNEDGEKWKEQSLVPDCVVWLRSCRLLWLGADCVPWEPCACCSCPASSEEWNGQEHLGTGILSAWATRCFAAVA